MEEERQFLFENFYRRLQMDEMAGALRRFSHVDLDRQGYGRDESRRRTRHASGRHATGESEAGARGRLRMPRRCRAHKTRL